MNDANWVVNTEFVCCPVHKKQGINTPLILDPEKPNMALCHEGCVMTLAELNEALNG